MIKIEDLMAQSQVTFGTSGARGRVEDMTDRVCYTYTLAFIRHLEAIGDLHKTHESIAVAGDLRPSTDRIMVACFKAIADCEYNPINAGKIPTPAVTYYGMTHEIPSVMVTGSHIPDDRNGIKFNKLAGEILKADEQGIRALEVDPNEDLFNSDGSFSDSASLPEVEENNGPEAIYLQRYLDFFRPDLLQGFKVGFYQHSAVGRDQIPQILESLGAQVTLLGHSDKFIPVDTEAIREEDVELAAKWSSEKGFDTILSTDGDSDRPLISDEKGVWLRGDIAGILTSQYLKADSVSVPVSCNSALDLMGFGSISRTRIGSPYVIESMISEAEQGKGVVTGYEANGGYFLGTDLENDEHHILPALPTRDTLIVFLAIMGLSREKGKPISELVADLPPRYTASGRIKEFPTEKSQALLKKWSTGNEQEDLNSVGDAFGQFGKATSLDRTDGLRITLDNGKIIHLRPSGNAPEFRCYTEASTEQEALDLKQWLY